ncbi:histidine kinase, partial [Streptomyces sp. NPDC002564]
RWERVTDEREDAEPEPSGESAAEAATAPESAAQGEGEGEGPKWERVTDKGLPKRTPKISAPVAAAPKPRSGSVDAEALRRRLGGFHRGAISGRRDVEAEIAGEEPATPARGNEENARAADVMGDPVEEASS